MVISFMVCLRIWAYTNPYKIMRLFTSILTAIAVFGLVLTGATKADAGDRYGKQKVVYHINYEGGDGGKKYRGAMRNIQNHINAVGAENMDIKVVLHGNGLGLLGVSAPERM